MRARRPINRTPKVLNGVGMPYALHLDEWGYLLNLAFGERPYLVGTAAVGKQWRDVDVRMIFDDEQWDRWIGRHEKDKSMIPAWFVLVAAISTWGREFTGLPIDFQFQLRSEIKDEDWKKPRLPLGLGFYGSNVLTADDMPKEREYAERILTDAGYTVSCPSLSRDDETPANATVGPDT